MNKAKIRGKIVEKYGTLENFSEAVGSTSRTVRNKIEGSTNMTVMDVYKWATALKIPKKEWTEYFFYAIS